jgi:uncharacterized cupin superfamily protein
VGEQKTLGKSVTAAKEPLPHEGMSASMLQVDQMVAELQRENKSLRGRIQKLKVEVAKEERRCKVLEGEKARLAKDNKALRKSRSWRLTSPIRAAVDICRALGSKRREVQSWHCIPFFRAASPAAERFFEDGFIAPVNLFTRAQCELILKHSRQVSSVRQGSKSSGAGDRFFYNLATRPALLAQIRALLGDDIVWWGTQIVRRRPGKIHPWHTDIESSAVDGRFVSVWIGLENTCQDAALQLISRSHKFGKPIQQEMNERGVERGEANSEMVIAWAREHDPLATLVLPDMTDGQAIVFDGRLWHASDNTSDQPRSALLLQYAAADMPIAFPDLDHLDWPFRFTSEVPVRVLVSGKSDTKTSPPPPVCRTQYEPVKTNVHLGDGFLPSVEGWKPYKLFRGPTPIVEIMKAHVSVLSPGHCPHPPHCHVEEELLIVLDGEAEIVIPDGPSAEGARVEQLVAGAFAYYPAYQYHTIRNNSASPVTYLMFKWQASPVEVEESLPTLVLDIGGKIAETNSKPRSMRVLFQGPTAYLGKLHAHVTDLKPGAGYAPHTDQYDVAILVFSGLVETLGQTIGPGGSIWYSAGEAHGMLNVGAEAARYLVFEFHAPKPTRVQKNGV